VPFPTDLTSTGDPGDPRARILGRRVTDLAAPPACIADANCDDDPRSTVEQGGRSCPRSSLPVGHGATTTSAVRVLIVAQGAPAPGLFS